MRVAAMFDLDKPEERVGRAVVDAAVQVHRELDREASKYADGSHPPASPVSTPARSSKRVARPPLIGKCDVPAVSMTSPYGENPARVRGAATISMNFLFTIVLFPGPGAAAGPGLHPCRNPAVEPQQLAR